MPLLGLGTVWAGYTLIYFGVRSLRGPGVGLLDLVIPGRTVLVPSTGGGTPSNSSSSGSALTPGPNTGGAGQGGGGGGGGTW